MLQYYRLVAITIPKPRETRTGRGLEKTDWSSGPLGEGHGSPREPGRREEGRKCSGHSHPLLSSCRSSLAEPS